MTICCARLSKAYMILTNALFASLGLAFLVFGSMGMKSDFYGSSLFPINTFKWLAILGAIVCVASIFGAIGAFIRKKFITCIYMIIILVALVLQVIIGIKIYKASANIFAYMSDLWTSASTSYRIALQNEFSCCGFQTSMDNYAITDQCQPTASSIQDVPPCADILINYAKSAFGKAYLVIFAALTLEVLAMTNAITLLCTSFDAEDENERRNHRKSGSSYTLPEEQKKHYADSPIGDSYSSYSAYDVNSPIHDSNRYEVYSHQNDSNIYHQDNHGFNTGSRVNAYY